MNYRSIKPRLLPLAVLSFFCPLSLAQFQEINPALLRQLCVERRQDLRKNFTPQQLKAICSARPSHGSRMPSFHQTPRGSKTLVQSVQSVRNLENALTANSAGQTFDGQILRSGSLPLASPPVLQQLSSQVVLRPIETSGNRNSQYVPTGLLKNQEPQSSDPTTPKQDPQKKDDSKTPPAPQTTASKPAPGDAKQAEAATQSADKAGQPAPDKVGSRMDPNKTLSSDDDVRKIGDRTVDNEFTCWHKIDQDTEIAMGKQYAKEIEAKTPPIKDPIISEYINRIGQKLVKSSDSKLPFTIKVIDERDDDGEPVINAFALPGGFFFVDVGLILAAENEAQLAAVMGHEIGHVAGRHQVAQLNRLQCIQLATIPLYFLGGWGGWGAREAASFLIPLGFLKFSRNFERKADKLGLEYMYKAGYDPYEFANMFRILKDKSKHHKIPKAFSTHPAEDDRIDAAEEFLETKLRWRDEYVVNTPEFQEVQAKLRALEVQATEEKQIPSEAGSMKTPKDKKGDSKDKDKKDKKDEGKDPDQKTGTEKEPDLNPDSNPNDPDEPTVEKPQPKPKPKPQPPQ